MRSLDRGAARCRIIAVSLITAVCLFGDSMLYVALPVHWREVGLESLWEVGCILSVNRMVRLPVNPFVGRLYVSLSTRSGILIASVLAVCTTLGYGYADSFAAWLGLRCLWGLAWTFLKLGAFFTILESSTVGNRGCFMGIYNGLYRLGSLVGMLCGGVLADVWGLRSTAVIFGLLSCPAAMMTLCFLSGEKASAGKALTNKTSLFEVGRGRGLLWVMGTGFLVALLFQGLYASTLSRLVREHQGETILLCGGVVLGCASLAGILQALRWVWEPWLAPWFGRRSDGPKGRGPLMAFSLWCSAAFFGLVSLRLPLPLWLLGLLGVQLTATALTTLSDAVGSDAAERSANAVTVLSAFAFICDLGAAAGPVVGYLMNDVWGIDAAYRCAAAALALLALKWSISPAVHRPQ